MSQLKFQEPFISCERGQLLPFRAKSFLLTVKVVNGGRELLACVGPSGSSEIDWILDSSGDFFEMESLGMAPRNPLQFLGLLSRKERLRINPARKIKIGELLSRVGQTSDRFREAPFARETMNVLKNHPAKSIVDKKIMVELLGG